MPDKRGLKGLLHPSPTVRAVADAAEQIEFVYDPAHDDGYELAYHEGKAAVASQLASLGETRDRAGTLMTAAAAIATIASALATRSSDLDLWDGWDFVNLGGLAAHSGSRSCSPRRSPCGCRSESRSTWTLR